MTFTEYQAEIARITASYTLAKRKVLGLGGGGGYMGLTPDQIKASAEYRAAKAELDRAWAKLRAFNGQWFPVFKKEIAADLDARRAMRLKEAHQ